MGFDKMATAAFALWFFLAQRALAQTTPCSSPGLPSLGQRSTTMSTGVPGTVIMRVQISKSGVIHDMEVFSDPSTLAAAAIKAVKRWKYKPAYWVTGPPSDRYTFLSVTLAKGAAPKIAEVEQGVPGGVGCVAAPERIRVSKAVMEKLLLSRIEPVYPPETQTEHIDGVVVVRITIDKGGSVSKADSVSGPPVLVPTAIEAVKQWKYQPFLLNGKPVEVETTVEMSFTR